MSTYGVNLTDGGNLIAAADLSAKQFCAVKANSTARQVALASDGGEAITGILQNTPAAGQAAEVTFDGFTKALAGTGGWTARQALKTEASTGALVYQNGSGTIVAVAHETVSAGEVGLVRVIPTAG